MTNQRASRSRLGEARALSRWGMSVLDTLALLLGERVPGADDLEAGFAGEGIDAARQQCQRLEQLVTSRSRPTEFELAHASAAVLVGVRRALAAAATQTASQGATAGDMVPSLLTSLGAAFDKRALSPDAERLLAVAEQHIQPAAVHPQGSAHNLPVAHLVSAHHPTSGPAVELAAAGAAPTSDHAAHASGRLRPTTDPLDVRYPRSALFRAGRWVMGYLWVFVVFGFALAGARLVSRNAPGASGIFGLLNLAWPLLLDRALLFSTTGLLLMVGLVVLMALLGVASSRARTDRRREHAVLRLRARAAAQATSSHVHVASSPAPIPSSAVAPDDPRVSTPAPADAADEPGA